MQTLGAMQTATCTLDSLTAVDWVIKYGLIGGAIGTICFHYLFGITSNYNPDPTTGHYVSLINVILVRSSLVAIIISILTAIFLRYIAPASVRACSDLPFVGI